MANSAKYSGVSPQVFDALRSKLAGHGLNLAGNNGRISEKGVSAEYMYDEVSQTLAINNVSVGFPASMMFSSDKIISTITDEITRAGGQLG